jgi:hypothetical protein
MGAYGAIPELVDAAGSRPGLNFAHALIIPVRHW